jgi:type I restriction enzyme S subunit
MSSEWKLQKISAIGSFDRGKSKHRPRDAKHLYGGAHPFIQTGDITNSNGRITSFRQTYSDAGLAQSQLWPVGTLAITIAANIAETALLTFPACFPDSVVGFTADPNKADVRFVEYLFQAMRKQVKSQAYGSAQENINLEVLRRLEFPIPPLNLQVQIADFLSLLDDRISLLRETNTTLESIAQALFKSWFVDFDPVRAKQQGTDPQGMDAATAALFPDSFEESELGEMPKGWRVDTIESVTERVGMGPFGSNIKVETFVPHGIPVISGQHLKQTLVEDNTFNFVTEEHATRLSKSCVQHGDVIFTHAGSIGQVSMLHASSQFERYILSQRQFFLRCNLQVIRPEWAIYFFRSPLGQHLLLANSSQVGVPSIARPVTYLRSIKIVVPPLPVTREFAEVIDKIHHRVMANRNQLKTLATLRDTLLPRLISGQLRLPA